MALYSSSLLSVPSITPAKKPMFKFNHLNLHYPCFPFNHHLSHSLSSNLKLKATPSQNYTYPDPIPEFAESETRKFKIKLTKTLMKDEDEFGDKLDEVVNVCAKILHEFLSKEYGGPGTLLVEPFTYMMIALKDNHLPGAPIAARASLLWAQNHLESDWQTWISTPKNHVKVSAVNDRD